MKDSIITKLNIDPQNFRAYSLGLLQCIAYKNLQADLSEVLQAYAFSVPEWKLLGQLHEHGPMRLAQLADYLSYDPPQVTKIAKALEKRKYVKRAQDRNDERAKSITITASGSALIEKLEPEVKKALAVILQGVTQAELRTYIKVLAVIVNNTKE